jgi:membrane-associated phospholipid phosphatase
LNRVRRAVAASLVGGYRAVMDDPWRAPLGWVLIAVSLSCLGLGLLVDRETALFIAAHPDRVHRPVFAIITKAGDATGWLAALVLGIGVCAGLARSARFQRHRAGLIRQAWNFWFIILACLVSGVIHHGLKIIIGRYRPRYLISEDLYGISPFNFDIAQNAFPSGHSQTIFSICAGLALVYPRFAGLFLMLAGVVAISRIALLAHYPSDVLFGAYLGICTAILLKRHYLDPRMTSLLNPPEAGR